LSVWPSSTAIKSCPSRSIIFLLSSLAITRWSMIL